MNKSLRLNQETQGTVVGESHRIMISLPEGSMIVLVGQVAKHPDMVEVIWQGQSVWVFAADFEARTKDVDITRPSTKSASVDGNAAEPKADSETNIQVNRQATMPVNTEEKVA